MRALLVALAALSLCSVSLGCARHGSAGEACSAPGLEPGALGDCADGLVCAPDRSGQAGNGQSAHWDTASCRVTCASSIDCPAGQACLGVTGAEYIMACQPN